MKNSDTVRQTVLGNANRLTVIINQNHRSFLRIILTIIYYVYVLVLNMAKQRTVTCNIGFEFS